MDDSTYLPSSGGPPIGIDPVETLQDDRAGVQRTIRAVQTELERVVHGQGEAIQCLLVGLIAGGHMLLEGVPGLAKTLLVRSLSQALRCSFSRIQFTPDLMPSDVTGVNIYDLRKSEFEFRPGPLFADLVLADEINRAPSKTQAALLEAMQEGQVSIDGQTRPLSSIFMVVATQNPIEYEGTYPLPEAQLDRFMMKVKLDYPAEAEERAMLKAMHLMGARSRQPSSLIQAVAEPAHLAQARRLAYTLQVDDAVIDYVLRLVRQSRAFPTLALGCSPRSAVMLLHAARSLALLRGKDYVSPDEVQAIALPVLRHRVQLTPEAEIEGLNADDCLRTLLSQVAIPR